ncbi:MAG: nickel pincer cofactor biosynthesis protein LarB [Verrucomicrobia bacterium]|nr:nickel pincer cofactor biosynthesis protein LarB [bacterium]NDA10214.1 nickel pincer cofactor biosynthesis protein LarB [Verrucomicrobiota bacterium]NDD56634.1 nickel pincer cofactor biosynthesis protein LarB [Verrucomicrobiota bacterium]NDD81550.1 nickel pincer cofactor biosynthesis protein LarB [Verrucomicrobiota bacterium]
MAPRRHPRTVLPKAFAEVDLQRHHRLGAPEIIYGAGKTTPQIVAIARRLLSAKQPVLVTRVDKSKGQQLRQKLGKGSYHPHARTFRIPAQSRLRPTRSLRVGVCAAGTSDHPVAEEALVTLEFLGHRPARFYDIGVAGLHRTLRRLDELRRQDALIVVAGMEAALPSVLGGLVKQPLVAVPTSVGYGAHLQGLTAFLGMLNSCAPGITVVNIDNGFGAAYAIHRFSLASS